MWQGVTRIGLALVLPISALIGVSVWSADDEGTSATSAVGFRVLLFTRTAGFRHDSIVGGVKAVTRLGAQHGFAVDHSADESVFTPENLDRYAVVVFLNTTGNLLDKAQREAFEAYINEGGGFVGIHAAADTGYDWPIYGELVGAYFESHPRIQEATIIVEDRAHPATRHLPEKWTRTDEWYNFRKNPRAEESADSSLRVLLRLDTSSYEGSTMGEDHPIAWCHEVGRGRAFYTACGHTRESFAEPKFLEHLLGAIRWTARQSGEALKRSATGNDESLPVAPGGLSPD